MIENAFADVISWLGDRLEDIVALIMQLLPDSPFQALTASADVIEWLGWVNYFIPIAQMLAVFQAWIIAVASYLVYSAMLRWIKAIQ